MNRLGPLLALLALSIGCGPTETPREEAPESAGGEARAAERTRPSARELIGITPPERPWSEMSYEEREMDMIGRFNPIFTEIFQEYDAERYAAFSCETCHGAEMRERNFAMPAPDLSPVPLPNTPAYRQMAAEFPQDTRFMEEIVTPTMQTMLGMGATFTCNGCHPVGS